MILFLSINRVDGPMKVIRLSDLKKVISLRLWVKEKSPYHEKEQDG